MKPVDALLATFIALALVAVLVGTNSKTADTITSAFSALSGLVGKIMQPTAGA